MRCTWMDSHCCRMHAGDPPQQRWQSCLLALAWGGSDRQGLRRAGAAATDRDCGGLGQQIRAAVAVVGGAWRRSKASVAWMVGALVADRRAWRWCPVAAHCGVGWRRRPVTLQWRFCHKLFSSIQLCGKWNSEGFHGDAAMFLVG